VPKEEHPIEAGPVKAPGGAPPAADDWPMYRCDMTRSAAAKTALPDDLKALWEYKPGKRCAVADSPLAADWATNPRGKGAPSQPVIAGGRVFMGMGDAKQVLALDAKTGKVAWTFHLPARTDAPPTIHKGLCLVGCHDGWVYALSADSGELVWRTRAAPAERRMMAYGQLESTWPVVGGVLVAGDTAYALAGRTTEADGGLYVLALEPATGRVLWTGRRYINNPGDIGAADHGRAEQAGAGAADLLASDGKSLIIGGKQTLKGRFDCATGKDTGNYTAPLFWSGLAPAAFVGKDSFVGQEKSDRVKQANINKKGGWKLAQGGWKLAQGGWKLALEAGSPVALAAAGERLVAGIAGEETVSLKDDTKAGAGKHELWLISAADGKKLLSLPLASAPAEDGIAVAGGRVFVATRDGAVLCFGKKE
jgi:outer membrane protein assembly factor BamB